ncbi:MAG: thioredoxin family protein [Cocleimonas sp.]
MTTHTVVSSAEWLIARKKLLAKEKEFTRQRDKLTEETRALPWVKIEKDYRFDGEQGQQNLSELFGDKSQLIIYHFMLGPDWDEGCPSCSFWADNFDGIDSHLAHRDIAFLAVSRGSYEQLTAYKKRMGWSFKWMSSINSDFNYDMGVSFSTEEKEKNEITYNYRKQPYFIDELQGVSVFYKNDKDEVFHTYSTYSRGVDILNGAYNYIDLSPKGRDEGDGIMNWLRRHDQY